MAKRLKYCSGCKMNKSLDNFHKNKSCKDGYSCYCKPCSCKYQSEYYHLHKSTKLIEQRKYRQTEKGKRNRKRAMWKCRGINISYERYLELLKEQNGRCAICKNPESFKLFGKIRSLVVDHNHNTKKIRGLLCSACNTAIGLLKEDRQLLLNVIKYIEKDKD